MSDLGSTALRWWRHCLFFYLCVASFPLFAEVEKDGDAQTKRVLFLGGGVAEDYLSTLVDQLPESVEILFYRVIDGSAFELPEMSGESDYDLLVFAPDSNRVLPSTLEVAAQLAAECDSGGLFISCPPASVVESDSVTEAAGIENRTVLKRSEASGLESLDLYDYVDIRRPDLLEKSGTGLSVPGKELVAAVVAGRILDLLKATAVEEKPLVVIMGDSIANGYHLPLKSLLEEEAVVKLTGTAFGPNPNWPAIARRAVNADPESGKPVVITFNWGLHALKFVDGNNRLASPETGSRCISPERYEQELQELVTALQGTGATLFWVTTTPENGSTWATKGDVIAYNAIAEEVMERNQIATIDLYEAALAKPDLQIPNDCHFRAEGYRRLATTMAETITVSLAASPEEDQ